MVLVTHSRGQRRVGNVKSSRPWYAYVGATVFFTFIVFIMVCVCILFWKVAMA